MILLLLYAPLALSITAVAFFAAQRLSRRGLGRFPRVPSPLHQNLAERLNATAVVDDAGITWRLRHPADLRIGLPFHPEYFDPRPDRIRDGRLAANPPDPESNPPRHFAFVLRWPLPRHRQHPALPVAFGLPVEMLSFLCTSDDGAPPPGAPQPAPPPFHVKSASVEKILRDWPAFDRDLDLLTGAALPTDFQRAFVLLRDELAWLDTPIWPPDQAPPAPFVINLMEDEAWVLCLFPGRTVADAAAAPEWVAEQMAWFAAHAPTLCSNISRVQTSVRDAVQARRIQRKAEAAAAAEAKAAAEVQAINADIEAAWPPPPPPPAA